MKTKKNRIAAWTFGGLAGAIVCMMFSTMTASAALGDVPSAFGNALGVTAYVGGMILSIGILVSCGVGMALAKMNFIGEVIVLLGLAGLLTLIGWLDYWLLLFAGLLIAAMFSKMIAQWILGYRAEA